MLKQTHTQSGAQQAGQAFPRVELKNKTENIVRSQLLLFVVFEGKKVGGGLHKSREADTAAKEQTAESGRQDSCNPACLSCKQGSTR